MPSSPRLTPCISPTQFRRFRKTIYFKLLILLPLAWISFLLILQILGSKSDYPDLPKLPFPQHQRSDLKSELQKPPSPSSASFHNELYPDKSGNELPLGVLAPPSELKPGEMGKPYKLPKNLTEEQKKLVSEGWKRNAFNQFVSDLISVRRSLPDPRDEW